MFRTLRASEQNRPDIARARRAWRRQQGAWDPARLIFLDEPGAKTNLSRLRERKTNRQERVRNGSLPPRKILTGIGPLKVQQPRVRDRRWLDLLRGPGRLKCFGLYVYPALVLILTIVTLKQVP